MNNLLYKVDDRPPLLATTLLAAQHMLAALGGIIAVPLVVGAILKLPADQVVALVNAALLGSGIVTIVQCKGVGLIGIRLPCVMGTSFAFVGAAISIGFEHGVAGILGSSLAGSVIMIVGSFFMPQIRKLFPHQVTAVVVTMIGLSLVPVAVDWAAGGKGAGDYGPDAMTARQALELATLGGAKVLNRDDIGSIAPGTAADIAMFKLDGVGFAGALHDPVAALVFCTPANVNHSVIDGKVVVKDGVLRTVDLPVVLERHNRLSEDLALKAA